MLATCNSMAGPDAVATWRAAAIIASDGSTPATRPDALRQVDADLAGAATDVEHRRAWRELQRFVILPAHVAERCRERGKVLDQCRGLAAAVDI